jgi:hypothetical protein
MKKIYTLISFSIFLITASAQTSFLKYFPADEYSEAKSVCKMSDGNFVLAGVKTNVNTSRDNYYLLKINSNGDTIWAKTLETDGDSYISSVIEGYDHSIICLGENWNGNYKINLIVLDSSGSVVRNKLYDGTAHDYGYGLTAGHDSTFIICGATASYGGNLLNAYLIKTDKNGDTLWTKILSTDSVDAFLSVKTLPTGYLAVGQTWGYGYGEGDALAIMFDENGNILWKKTYGGRWDEFFSSITPLADGNILLCGNTESWWGGVTTDTSTHPPFNHQDFYLVKIKPDGDTLWTQTYGGGALKPGYDIPYTSMQLSNGNILATGRGGSFSTSTDGYYVIVNNSNGNLVSSKVVEGSFTDIIYSCTDAGNNQIFAAGVTRSFGSTQNNFMLAKINQDGFVGCQDSIAATVVGTTRTKILSGFSPVIISAGIVDSVTLTEGVTVVSSTRVCSSTVGISENEVWGQSISVFPNPTLGILKLKTENNAEKNIFIYDCLGKIIFQKQGAVENEIEIDLTTQPQGVYTLKILQGENIVEKKIVVL